MVMKSFSGEGRQRTRAIAEMALSSALHFAGFELARSGTMALFTSERIGFSSPSAAPLSLVCVTPFSYFLLCLYTRSLQRRGPRRSLFYSTLAFAIVMGFGACSVQSLEHQVDHGNFFQIALKTMIFLLHVVESSFVQLLSTQHWSFLGSVCGKDGIMWFSPIAGIGSVASTLAAISVSPLVGHVGLSGLLGISACLLVASGAAGDDAYRLGGKYLEPVHGGGPESGVHRKSISHSLFETSCALFERVPILASLCIEVLTCQCVAAIINFLFVMKLKECIKDDEQRARWMGMCYAWINASSGVLQFAILPLLVKKYNSRRLWLLMPSVMMLCATLMTYQKHITLHMVAATFALYKALEYSVRGVALEMVFVTLDYESRFIGKEIIGVFVNRFGRSIMAVALSLAANLLEANVLTDKIFVQTLSVSGLLWFYVSYPLSQRAEKAE